MLSIFPELLVYTLAAPLFLRLAASTLFFVWSVRAFGSDRHTLRGRLAEWGVPAKESVFVLAAAELVIAVLLFVGLYTQAAALAGALLAAACALMSRREPFGSATMTVYLLVAVISLSLAFTGPGFFAFDLPL